MHTHKHKQKHQIETLFRTLNSCCSIYCVCVCLQLLFLFWFGLMLSMVVVFHLLIESNMFYKQNLFVLLFCVGKWENWQAFAKCSVIIKYIALIFRFDINLWVYTIFIRHIHTVVSNTIDENDEQTFYVFYGTERGARLKRKLLWTS